MTWIVGQNIPVGDDTKLGIVVDTKESSASIQRDLSKLKDWAERNLPKLN